MGERACRTGSVALVQQRELIRMATSKLQVGAPAPWFRARSPNNDDFHFDTVAGRYIVLCFFGSASEPACRSTLAAILRRRRAFDDHDVAFFGVSVDPEDERSKRVRERLPGVHLFWDLDRKVSRLYGAAPIDEGGAKVRYFPRSVVLDERLRVVSILPFGEPPERHAEQLMAALAALPPLDAAAPVSAPILSVPRVFEPELCQALIRYYEEHGGGESGFMLDIDGKTVGVQDPRHKRRRDREVEDETLKKACMVRVHDRVLPEIRKAFQFEATRIERYLVACYEADAGGHFRAHRDNTTRGTAHRRFAVSLVLNGGAFEGGGLRFPEFGRQAYFPPAGAALVFSCSLLHEVTPVKAGKRFVFLPFLYDEPAARLREENARWLARAEPLRLQGL